MDDQNKGQGGTPRNWFKNWLSKLSKEWMAVIAVLAIVGIGVIAGVSNPEIFQGNFDLQPLDNIQLDDPSVKVIGQPEEIKPQIIDDNLSIQDPGFNKVVQIDPNVAMSASKSVCEAIGMDYDATKSECVPFTLKDPIQDDGVMVLATPQTSETCMTYLSKIQELDRIFNNEIEKNAYYTDLTTAKVAEGKEEVKYQLNAFAFTMTQIQAKNCSVPQNDDFAQKVCESSDYAGHVAYEFERDFFNDIGYPRSDFNCSQTFSSNIDVAKKIYNYVAPVTPPAPIAKPIAPTIIIPTGSEKFDNGTTAQDDPIEWTFAWKDNTPQASNYQIRVTGPTGFANLNIDETIATSETATRIAQDERQWSVEFKNPYVPNNYLTGWSVQIRAKVGDNWSDWSKASFTLESVDTDKSGGTIEGVMIELDIDLDEDRYSEIDAEVSVSNVGSTDFDADKVEFKVENVTDRLSPVTYTGEGFKDLSKGDSAEVYDLQNIPTTSARGDKLIKIQLYADGKLVAEGQETIDYDGSNYDPYRPRTGGSNGRYVELRGVVRENRGEYVLTDENNRFIAYLVNSDDDFFDDYENEAVEVEANVDRYSCQGSTLVVSDIRELGSRESLSNSMDDLYIAGAICYRDIDTRPVYDQSTGNVTILVDENNPWYLRFVIDMFERGIMKGDRNGVFDPARNISIAEVVKMATLSARIPVADEYTCLDRGQPWFCNVMDLANDRAWLSVSALRDPNRQATRAEVVELVLRAFEVTPDYRSRTFPDLNYDDRNTGYIEAARRIGIVDGYPDGTFRPNAPINRAEVSKIYSNAIRIIAERRAGL